ncbi:unnamed protein product [Leuciscus chuanchicus]
MEFFPILVHIWVSLGRAVGLNASPVSRTATRSGRAGRSIYGALDPKPQRAGAGPCKASPRPAPPIKPVDTENSSTELRGTFASPSVQLLSSHQLGEEEEEED